MTLFFGDSAVEDADPRGIAVGCAIGLKEIEHARRGLVGVNGRAFAEAQNEEREEPDVRPDIDDRVSIRELDAVAEVGLVLEDFPIDVIRFVAVEVDDLDPVREDGPRPRAKARGHARRVGRLERGPVFVQPVLQAEDDHVDALAIPAERTRRVEQLLEDLIVRRELNARGQPKSFAPKPERFLERFGGEGRGDAKPRRFRQRRLTRRWPVDEGEHHAGEFPKARPVCVNNLDGAEHFRPFRLRRGGERPPWSRSARRVDHEVVD